MTVLGGLACDRNPTSTEISVSRTVVVIVISEVRAKFLALGRMTISMLMKLSVIVA